MRPVETKNKLRKSDFSSEFALKIYYTPKGKIIAACDYELLGKEFEDGEKILHLKKDFYFGKIANIYEIIHEIGNFFTANFVGEKIIQELISRKIIHKENVKRIGGVPHIQIFVI